MGLVLLNHYRQAKEGREQRKEREGEEKKGRNGKGREAEGNEVG